MIPYRVGFVFLAALVSLTSTEYPSLSEEEKDERTDCGQYGFRCLDEKTLEFCPIAVDGVTERANIYECEDDFACDEDNPAYCTPREPPNKLLHSGNKEEQHGVVADAYDDVYFDEDAQAHRQSRIVRASIDDDDDETTTLETPATTESDDETDFTTIVFTPSPPFECDSYGFFADKSNSTLFWYCDVPLNGVGFLLRHMMCGHERYFDETLRNCILQGTIRQERKYESAGKRKKVKNSMDCTNRKPGKYADKMNCQVYHLCLPKQFTPAIQLTFMCPHGTAFDVTCQSCTIAAFNRCQAKEQSSTKNKINCRSPTRFRSIDDCNNYYLCFIDNVIAIKCPKFYKFDDNALECLPEKSAECKEYSV